MKKQNNKGFSLIEIIVVLAIMGIAVAGSISLYSSLSKAKVKSATNHIDSQLSLTRTNTLSKKGYWMFKLCVEDNNYCAVVCRSEDGSGAWEEYKKVSLGSVDSLDITYTKLKVDDAGNITKIPNVAVKSFEAKIIYDSSSGACLKSSGEADYYVGDITITDGSIDRVISITRATGKHYVD